MLKDTHEAIASATRRPSIHRLHLVLVIARTESHCAAALSGGVELDARLRIR